MKKLEASESTEVGVERDQSCTVFDCQRGQVSIGNQVGCGAGFANQILKYWPVLAPRIQQFDDRQGKPTVDDLGGLIRGEGIW